MLTAKEVAYQVTQALDAKKGIAVSMCMLYAEMELGEE